MTLFLDIDGVLNIINPIYSTQLNGTVVIEAPQMMLLDNILDTYQEIDIIITSTRRDNMDKLERDLKQANFRNWDALVGTTDLNGKKRGQQIQDYINKNQIDNYLVIDDEVGGICGIDGKFIPEINIIKIDPIVGLTYYDQQKIIKIIKTKKDS